LCGFIGFATRHRRRSLASATRVQLLLLSSRCFLPPNSKLFSKGVSASVATATPDAPAIITLNSKNHVVHHLSVTGQHQRFARIVIDLIDKEEGTPQSASPVLLAGARLNDRANPCRHRCCRHRHRFGRPNPRYHCHDRLIHSLP
jgi:hypothetical protein